MRILLLIVLIVVLPLFTSAHATPGLDGSMTAKSPHGGAPAGSGAPSGRGNSAKAPLMDMTTVLKQATLSAYKDVKIGEAFEKYRYLKKKDWHETRAAAGTFYIDFTGYTPTAWFDFKAKREGISAKGIEVKFVIHSDGTYGVGMISRVEVKSDGKTYRYPLGDAKSVLDAIYANRKIDL
jgi:hypothetical protein